MKKRFELDAFLKNVKISNYEIFKQEILARKEFESELYNFKFSNENNLVIEMPFCIRKDSKRFLILSWKKILKDLKIQSYFGINLPSNLTNEELIREFEKYNSI